MWQGIMNKNKNKKEEADGLHFRIALGSSKKPVDNELDVMYNHLRPIKLKSKVVGSR